MLDAYIYDGLRTPFGRHGGALAPVRPDDLLAGVIRELVQRNRFEPAGFEDVVIGNTNQAGEDARNVARHAGLLAGLPESVAGITVNRLCGSGLAATLDAARMVTVGEGELIIAGGTESMSRAPFVMAKAEKAFSRDMTIFDSTIGARFPNPTILQQFGGDTMPETAQNVAEDLGISRESADAFAARSQQRYQDARERGFFREEITPVTVPQGRKKDPLTVTDDEHPRPGTGVDKLAKLPAIVDGDTRPAAPTTGPAAIVSTLSVAVTTAANNAGNIHRATVLAISTNTGSGLSPHKSVQWFYYHGTHSSTYSSNVFRCFLWMMPMPRQLNNQPHPVHELARRQKQMALLHPLSAASIS